MFRRLLRRLQGELICMLKTVVTLCDFIGLKLLYNHLKDRVCLNMELKTLKSLCKAHFKLCKANFKLCKANFKLCKANFKLCKGHFKLCKGHFKLFLNCFCL
jgi:hypothetical protein